MTRLKLQIEHFYDELIIVLMPTNRILYVNLLFKKLLLLRDY
jgi:hypothetical protein